MVTGSELVWRSRGYISDEYLPQYAGYGEDELVGFLKEGKPYMKTLAVKLLGRSKKEKHVPLLCDVLRKEDTVYTRIAASEALASYGAASLKYLVPLIGKVGRNQHQMPSLVDLGKHAFPLPRDIVARTIARIGPCALPMLEEVLTSGKRKQVLEAVDAVGYIAYHYGVTSSEDSLFIASSRYPKSEMVNWKVIRALRSFPSDRSVQYLSGVIEKKGNRTLVEEAGRSLRQIRE